LQVERLQIGKGSVIDYGTNTRYLYLWFNDCFDKGCNLVCSELYHVIRAIKTGHGEEAKAETLVLQADNA
jgi:hypothetical protein